MIIWSGLGFLVAVIIFGCSLALNFAFNAWFGDGYYDTHKWPFAISLFLSAIICWFLEPVMHFPEKKAVLCKGLAQIRVG